MDLFGAYLATSFFADTPRGRLCIRIGQNLPLLDQLLEEHNAAEWSYITAYNPASQQLSDGDNQKRLLQLELEVKDRGLVVYEGEGLGDEGAWPAEKSILVLGIGRAEAEALGRKYGQNAVVCGHKGGPAELVWMTA